MNRLVENMTGDADEVEVRSVEKLQDFDEQLFIGRQYFGQAVLRLELVVVNVGGAGGGFHSIILDIRGGPARRCLWRAG